MHWLIPIPRGAPTTRPDDTPVLPTPEYFALFGDMAVLRWSVQLRWAVLAALLALNLALELFGMVSLQVLGTVTGLAAFVMLYNLGFQWWLRGPALRQPPSRAAWARVLQLPADLLLFTVALHLVGGATTPVIILYAFFVITGIVIMPRRGAYVAAALGTAFYGTLVVLERTVLPPPANSVLAVAPAGAAASYYWHVVTLTGILWLLAWVADRLAQRIQLGEGLIGRQLHDLSTLYRFSDSLSGAPDLEQTLQQVVNELSSLLGASGCSVMLLNAQGQAEFRAAAGLSAGALAAYRLAPLAADHPLLAAVVDGGTGLFAPAVDAVPGLRQVLIRPDTCSFYSVPLRSKTTTVGLLNLSFNVPYTMAPGTLDLVHSCARQAGLAIERALLYEDAQRAAREMGSLYRIALATSSSLEIERVLGEIADQVEAVLAAELLVLALRDPETQLLDFVVMRDHGVDLPHEPPLAPGESGAAGWIVEYARPLLVRHWDEEIADLPFADSTYGEATQSYVGVPLVVADRLIGVLSAQRVQPYAYDEKHLSLLAAIGAQVALALENARLHAAAREQAKHDSLTGALNHAELLAQIAAAVAHPAGGDVALIMLDLDFFKDYNDRYGHQAGDVILREVVRAIGRHVKSTDYIGRWGGEEFGVVLPGASCANAHQVAERIRATLAEMPMSFAAGRPLPAPTVSQGIACFPDDSASAVELVEHADGALYTAKARGRDTIVQWRAPARAPVAR